MNDFEPVGVAVLGAGRPNVATQNHLPAIVDSPLLKLVAVGDLLPGVDEYAAQYGVKAYRDYDDLLADPEVEIVQVATPDWCHAEQAIRAVEAGKHVQVQKPLCVSLEEIEGLKAAQERTGRYIGVVLNTRRLHRWRVLRDLVVQGVVGELKQIDQFHVGRRYPLRDLASPYYTTRAGSVWLHNGMHLLDTASMYAGAPPVAVQAVVNRNPEGDPEFLGAAENFVRALIEFENGVAGVVEHNTMMTSVELPSFGFVRLLGADGEIYAGRDVAGVVVRRRGEEERVLDLDPPEGGQDVHQSFRTAFEEFARTVRDGQEREPTFALSCQVMATLLRTLDAAEEMAV